MVRISAFGLSHPTFSPSATWHRDTVAGCPVNAKNVTKGGWKVGITKTESVTAGNSVKLTQTAPSLLPPPPSLPFPVTNCDNGARPSQTDGGEGGRGKREEQGKSNGTVRVGRVQTSRGAGKAGISRAWMALLVASICPSAASVRSPGPGAAAHVKRLKNVSWCRARTAP